MRLFVALLALCLVAPACLAGGDANARHGGGGSSGGGSPDVLVQFAEEHLRLVATTGLLGPPAVARALSVYTTCVWDAVSVYTKKQQPVHYQGRRQPSSRHTNANRRKAAALAAFRCIEDIFGATHASELTATRALAVSFGVDPDYRAIGTSTPEQVANGAAAAVLAFRHRDGSNQKGDEPNTVGGAIYSDYTNHVAAKEPQPVAGQSSCEKLSHWQPLRVGTRTQSFLLPQWSSVKPFALPTAQFFRPASPSLPGTPTGAEWQRQVDEVVTTYETLGDYGKVIAEYWADGPRSETPPGHWHEFAVELINHRGLQFLPALKLLFAQAQAVFDGGIAAWEAKRYYDTVRPVTAIQCTKANQVLTSWLGPHRGVGPVNGSLWQPYQALNFVTPPFPEYVSGHSTFSAASAEVFRRFFGSDAFGSSFVQRAGTSFIEPKITSGPGFVAGVTDVPNSGPASVGYVPASDLTLSWATFTEAAAEAGISRIFGGIHIADGNVAGLELGSKVGALVYKRVQLLATGEEEDDDDNSSSWGVGIGIGAVALVGAGGVAALVRRRRKAAAAAAEPRATTLSLAEVQAAYGNVQA